jgi:hypothetical protein
MEKSNCRIEIDYIDPQTYTSIVNHDTRKEILKALYRMGRAGPVSKQQIADALNIDYHQLVYQLNHHLRDFWTVVEERKMRGTRMELIAPADPFTVFIAVGKEGRIHIIDPLGCLFGPLAKVGTRCDHCNKEEVARCSTYVNTACTCSASPSDAEQATLKANGRKPPYRPMDSAILCALKGLAARQPCAFDIPCDGCAFLRKTISIE